MTDHPSRYLLEIAYRGTRYHGWQVQPNATTIQGVIQERLEQLLQEEVPIVGSSRTDTGVHALQQFAHVDLDAGINIDQLHHRLNVTLPSDIAIRTIRPIAQSAHARFDASSRTYLYTIAQAKQPFRQETSYWLRSSLDVVKMNEAAQVLLRKQDFKSLCKMRPVDQHFLCTIMEVGWTIEEELLIFRIKANRFLRSMVRMTVGLLLQVGQRKVDLVEFEALIDRQERDLGVSLVPAHGLALTAVTYPPSLFVVP